MSVPPEGPAPGQSSEDFPDIQAANLAFLGASTVLLQIATQVQEMAESMSSTKTEKGAKKIGSMFKTMAKAAPQAFVLEKLMMLLEPFINLLDLISPIIEILAAIIEIGLMPIIQELMPWILMAVQFLWKYKDAMAQVVRWIIIGIKWLFAMNVIWKTLINTVMFLYEWHVKLLAIGMDVVKWLVNLISFFQILVDWHYKLLAIGMGVLEWVMSLVNAFLIMVPVIGFLTEKIHSFLKMIKDMIDDFTGMGFDIPGFAEGGIVTAPTIAKLGETEPEFIVPFSKMGEFGGGERINDLIYATEENTAVQQEILALKERKARWAR